MKLSFIPALLTGIVIGVASYEKEVRSEETFVQKRIKELDEIYLKLNSNNINERIKAITALSDVRDIDKRNPLLDILKRTKDPHIKAIVIETLATTSDYSKYDDTTNQLIMALKDAKSTFITQRRSQYNLDEDAKDKNGNCGPVALACIAKHFIGSQYSLIQPTSDLKELLKPSNHNNNELIKKMRKLMGAKDNDYDGITLTQLENGAIKLGLQATFYNKKVTIDQMKIEIQKGKRLAVETDKHVIVVTNIIGDFAVVQNPSGLSPHIIPVYELKFSNKRMIAIGT